MHTPLPTSIPASPSLLYLFYQYNISYFTKESFSFSPFRIAAAAQRVVEGLIGCLWGIFDWDLQTFLHWSRGMAWCKERSKVGCLSLTEKNMGFTLEGGAGKMRKIISAIGVIYFTAWVLIKWHDALVNVDCRRYAHLSCWRQIN